MYYTYILRCEDNSLYSGMTIDLVRRMEEHFSGGEKCAKYTMRHKPKKLEIAWQSESRRLASKLEYHLKKLPKAKKETLIKKPEKLREFLGEKIESKEYLLFVKEGKILGGREEISSS